jgi:hypothetical protein
MNRHASPGSETDMPPDECEESPADDTNASIDADGIVDTEALAQRVEPTPVPAGYSRLNDEAEATIRRDGLTQFYGLRRMWSGWLIAWVSVLICFQIVLTFSIGLGLLDYRDYDWFLPLVTAQNFLQIVGMAIVVVRFLHSGSKQTADVDSF